MRMDSTREKFYKAGYYLIVFLLVSAGLWILSHFTGIIMIIIASIFLTYILFPVMRFFENPIVLRIPEKVTVFKREINLVKSEKKWVIRKNGFSRNWSLFFVFILFIIVVIIFLSLIIPAVIQEITTLIENLPELTENVQQIIDDAVAWIEPQIPEGYEEQIDEFFNRIISTAGEGITGAATYMFTLAQQVVTFTLALFAIPLFTFYIMINIDSYRKGFWTLIPERKKSEVEGMVKLIDQVVGRYIRGEIIVGIFIFITVTTALQALGLPYSVLIGLLSGLFNFVPYLGAFISLFFGTLVALIHVGFVYALITFAILQIIQLIESQFVTPNVLSGVIGLPPLIIIVSLLIGAQVMGLLGMLIAVPVVAIMRAIVMYYIRLGKKVEKPEEDIIDKTNE
jgi:predicted PurR-regulated permease PerM